ncbi:hypothetical protein HMPREF1531_00652 [Propionibacterium sp. oral taxon 192 str. F0372]|uniref:DUF6782 family putative metallopeptidase n=1 Tax=Propionibacterium sp. oral taxon 192 TaxID=671222 RepID=UPI0003541FA9|nr:DUF6782 family putative metallopeptidase [Propionibacterium sp. oral taxon 192]EPH06004.1 hypothetical protein HMPREF1531_00652 [Propionibacterium sp. oral taxon 192 str. F0372]
MSDWVFAATGVHPPAVAPEELDKLNERWHTLTTKVQESTTTTGKIISDITTHNTGEAADAFTSCMNASGIPTRLTTFQQHTNTIEQAHTTASSILHDTTTQMQAKAAELNTNLRRALTTPNLQTPITLFTLLKKAQQDLHTIDTTNAQAITNAYQGIEQHNFDSPDAADAGSDRGTPKEDVAEKWKAMDNATRMAAAQKIVDEQFRYYGMEPIKITWDDTLDGSGVWEEDTQMIKINPNELSDPDILHTLAHEVRHAAQHKAVREKMTLDTLFIPSKEYFMKKYGATPKEVELWESNFNNYIKPDEHFPGYLDQPVEVDARQYGKQFVKTLTVEKLEEYCQ